MGIPPNWLKSQLCFQPYNKLPLIPKPTEVLCNKGYKQNGTHYFYTMRALILLLTFKWVPSMGTSPEKFQNDTTSMCISNDIISSIWTTKWSFNSR